MITEDKLVIKLAERVIKIGIVENLKLEHQQFAQEIVKLINKGEKNFKLKHEINIFKKALYKHFIFEEEKIMINLSTLVDIEESSFGFIYNDHKKIKDFLVVDEKQILFKLKRLENLFAQHVKQEEEIIYFMVEKFLTEERLKILEEELIK